MSMLSAQADELRELAGDGSVEFVSGPIRASVLREAADTILELRDDLQQANAENARLRSELESVGTAAYLYGRSDLNDENAKLRELVQKMMQFFEDGNWCTTCECAKECEAQEQYEEDCLMRSVFHDRMRELGVEVDDAG